MKNIIFFIVALAFGGFSVWYFFFNKEDNNSVEDPKPQAVAVNSNAPAFDQKMQYTLEIYYKLSEDLIAANTTTSAASANKLQTSLTELPTNEIQADSNLISFANVLITQIVDASKTVGTAKDIETQRKSYQIISARLFDLLRTIQYKGSAVYQVYCPMAFDNTGAAWLSPKSEVINPYFGDKMLHCGEVRDSLATGL